jgi:hypothetical protein
MKKAQMGGSYASRRAYKGQPSPPSPKKDDSSSPKVETIKSTPGKARTDAAGMEYAGRQIASYLNEKNKEGQAPARTSTTSAPARTSRANTPVSSTPAPNRQQKITPKKGLSPIALPERKKPTVTRQYSKTERSINEQIEKIKKGEGSTEAAQMKIKALRAKERMANDKAERKEVRTEKRSNRATNKTISRISKVNNNPKNDGDQNKPDGITKRQAIKKITKAYRESGAPRSEQRMGIKTAKSNIKENKLFKKNKK